MAPSCDLDFVRRVHVMGVCGTGMGSFAGLLKQHGFEVQGSDAGVYPPMSDALADWGIPVLEGYSAANLGSAPDLVIVGNVIRRTNPEAVAMRRRGIRHVSFPEALGRLFLADRTPLVVTGTHGKTTTAALLAWLLESAGLSPGFLVGGLPADFPQAFSSGRPPYFVVEGDEYDTAYFDKGAKFLHYRPHHAILTSLEYDHADIFPDLAAVERAFRRFVALIPREGTLTVCGHAREALQVARAARCRVETYGHGPEFDWSIRDEEYGERGTSFSLHREGRLLGRFESPMFGRHNVQNAAAAIAVAAREGVEPDVLARALGSFGGVRKRQEVRGEAGGVTVIDDFAHHPTAVRESLFASRQRYPRARLWALYHPESNTARRRVFEEAYSEAFDDADEILISEALKKPDGLPPDEQLHIGRLVRALRARGKSADGDLSFDEIFARLQRDLRPGDVVVLMSGRDFGGLHDRLLAAGRPEELRG